MEKKEMRTCIKEFIKHTEDLEAEEDPDGCGYNREYRRIHEVQIKNRRDNVFTQDVGKLEPNLKKNRYKDILPYDDHRVHIKKLNDDENSDYINASHLMGVKGSGGYIASQGPLAATVNDYWRMIWEYDIEIVFMACRTVELGKIKCKQYWHDLNCSDDFGDINVFTEEEKNISSDFTMRTFRVKRGEEERKVTQYHYSGWPDHGVPSDPAHIRDLIALMRKQRSKDKSPLLVHCSAGCGRTGAIIAIDYVWTLLEEGKFDEKFNLYDLICKFREQRMSIVQTPDQYNLVYKVLKSLCEEWIAKMASHTYVNVEIEDEYVNINEIKKEKAEEEHVYEDSQLKDMVPVKSPAKPVGSASENKGPVIIDVSRSSDTKANGSNRNSSSSDVSMNNKPPTPAEEETKEVLHRTVIQIGVPSGGGKQKVPGSPSGKTGKGRFKMFQGRGTVSRGTISKTLRPLSDTIPGGNKQEVVNLVTSGGAKRSVTLPRESQSPGSTSPLLRSKSTPVPGKPIIASSSAERLSHVPDTIPGFPDKLPKVKGPLPTPAEWRDS